MTASMKLISINQHNTHFAVLVLKSFILKQQEEKDDAW